MDEPLARAPNPISLGGTAVALALAVFSGTGAQPATAPLLVVVSLDTVRADGLGAWRDGAVTPHLDALAAHSAVFAQAFTVVPTTLASHTALFTGKFPHTHGVPRNGFVVDDGNVTLAEALKGAGWRTAGFVGGSPLEAKTHINQGFDVWDDDMGRTATGRPAYARAGELVVDDALRWLDEEDPQDPRGLFLFVHLYDAHAPYWAPQGYLDATPGPYVREDADAGARSEIGAANALCVDREGDWKERGDVLRKVYYAGVSWTDHEVGRLLHGLEVRGALDGALVVVVGDHGEGFDDHKDCWDHGYEVYDDTTHIPLLVHGPGVEVGRSERLASNIDVMPAVLEWLGVPVPGGVEGVSFAPELRGERQPPRREVFSEATKPHDDAPTGWINRRRLKAVRTARERLTWDPVSDQRELYFEEPAPGEQHDRWQQVAARPESRLLDLDLGSWAASADPLPTVQLDDDATVEALRALGYVDGAP
jgi:arylsulfatase A-like enzyme